MILKQLLASTPIFEIRGSRQNIIKGLAIDTDNVRQDYLYIYIEDREDMGYEESIEKAVSLGATAVCIGQEYDILPYDITFVKTYNVKRFLSAVSKNFYQNPSQSIDMIGITGSHGKTTVGTMVRSILKAAGVPTVMINTSSCILADGPPYIHEDILNPIVFTKFLREAADRGIKRGIIECSYTTIVEERLRHIWFDSLIYTDLYTYFKNQEKDCHYLEIRKTLIDHLKHIKCPIIVNMDDYHANQLKNRNIVGYGVYGRYSVTAKDIVLMPDSSEFTIQTPRGSKEITLGSPGLHNVYNAMAAIGWCVAEGIEFPYIEEGLKRLEGLEHIQYNKDMDITNPISIKVYNYSTPNEVPKLLAKGYDDNGYDNRVAILCVPQCEDSSVYKDIGNALNKFSRYCVMTLDHNNIYNFKDSAYSIVQNMPDSAVHYEIDHYKALKKSRNIVKDGGSIVVLAQENSEH